MATRQDNLPAPSPIDGVQIEVLTLATDPPGVVREAPGGGRVLTQALLFRPTAGENSHAPAVVMLDEGPGSHPTHWGEPTRWAAERLAARGYTVVSLYSHMERGHPLFELDETAYEIDAALNMLEARGYEAFVLAGHSYGAVAAANYLATRPDDCLDQDGEKRVKAVVMFNPLTELRAFPGADLGRGYDERMARAKASFASGRGSIPTGNTLAVAGGPGAEMDDWIASGAFVQPAELTWDYWGPDRIDRNAELLAAAQRPTLMLVGGRDPTVSQPRVAAWAAAASAPCAIDVVYFAEGDRFFAGLHDAATDAVAAWLRDKGLDAPPAIEMRILDAATSGDRILPGLFYQTRGGADPEKPAFLLVHGRTGDTLFSSTHWLGWRLAQAGHAVLTPSLRISGAAGLQSCTTAQCCEDIAAWMDTLERLGCTRVVLAGHSNGGIWISDYMAESDDPRVAGLVYVAPTAIWVHPNERLSDPVFAERSRQVQAAIAEGRAQDLVLGVLSASTWWDYNRPDTRTVHTERVALFDRPALSIIGGRDALFTDGQFMRAFETAYRGSLEQFAYENGTHGFRENKQRLTVDILDWVRRALAD